MRVCDGVTATFDDPNLVSCAGLALVLELALRLQGVHELHHQPSGVVVADDAVYRRMTGAGSRQS